MGWWVNMTENPCLQNRSFVKRGWLSFVIFRWYSRGCNGVVGEIVAEGSQHQPRECEQAQALGEGFDLGHGNLRECVVMRLRGASRKARLVHFQDERHFLRR